MSTGIDAFAVVICGGVAGIEGLVRLRRLAGDRIAVTLLTPKTSWPTARSRYLSRSPWPSDPLSARANIAGDAGARWVRDSAAWVD
jgi:hypothetical protein